MGYHVLMDQLIDQMVTDGSFDIPRIYSVMGELCKLLRVSKGVTSFFKTP